jgi:hypothetical protein
LQAQLFISLIANSSTVLTVSYAPTPLRRCADAFLVFPGVVGSDDLHRYCNISKKNDIQNTISPATIAIWIKDNHYPDDFLGRVSGPNRSRIHPESENG